MEQNWLGNLKYKLLFLIVFAFCTDITASSTSIRISFWKLVGNKQLFYTVALNQTGKSFSPYEKLFEN